MRSAIHPTTKVTGVLAAEHKSFQVSCLQGNKGGYILAASLLFNYNKIVVYYSRKGGLLCI